jgi:hypothetical protein
MSRHIRRDLMDFGGVLVGGFKICWLTWRGCDGTISGDSLEWSLAAIRLC